MIIIGIDPGYGKLGYGVIEKEGHSFKICEAGTITTDSKTLPQKRLEHIHASLQTILSRWKPSALSIERIFLSANQKTAIPVAEARGVVLLTAALGGLTVYEYTPSQVKLAMTGSGKADKKAVEKMISLMAGASLVSQKEDDAIDAIALAITAAYDTRPPV